MKWLIDLITFKAFRMRRARARYDFLKAEIAKRHFEGYGGLIMNTSKLKRYSKKDFACFPAPMYMWIKNAENHWCVFWDRGRMTREIGTGAPIKDGAELLPDHPGRTRPEGTLETINEKQPAAVASGQSEDV